MKTRIQVGKPEGEGGMKSDLFFRPCLDYLYVQFGGGMGGAQFVSQGRDRVEYSFDEQEMNAETTLIKILSNYRVYSNAESDGHGNYLPVYESSKPTYIGISPTSGMADAKITEQTEALGGPFKVEEETLEVEPYYISTPVEIDFTRLITQPKSASYTGKIYITVAWFNSNWWTYGEELTRKDVNIDTHDFRIGL